MYLAQQCFLARICKVGTTRSVKCNSDGKRSLPRPNLRRLRVHREKQKVRAASVDPSATAKNHAAKEGSKTYAVLHDFCMTIPYGAVVAITGLIGCISGQGNIAIVATFVGFATCLSSYFSLRAWKLGQSNSRYTMASAGLASAVGALSWRMIQAAKGKVAGNILIALSSALVLFLIYNLAAGGNPPKRHH